MANNKKRSGLWEHSIAIYLSNDVYALLKQKADDDDRKPSAYARKVLTDHLRDTTTK